MLILVCSVTCAEIATCVSQSTTAEEACAAQHWGGCDLSIELRALHYDNRGDPTVFVARVADYIWQTRFDAIGLRLETANGWTVIAQRMDGSTTIEPGGTRLRWDYDASFLLVSRELGGRQSPAGCRACASSAASGSSVPYIRPTGVSDA